MLSTRNILEKIHHFYISDKVVPLKSSQWQQNRYYHIELTELDPEQNLTDLLT